MWEDFSTDEVTVPQWGRREFLKMSALLGRRVFLPVTAFPPGRPR